jgi:hypothetical protein
MSTKISNEEAGPPPAWWHPHGFKMGLQEINPRVNANHAFLRIGTGVAQVEVAADDGGRTMSFSVHWTLIHSRGRVSGTVYMLGDILTAAFGLTDVTSPDSESFVAKYKATAGAHGIFLRRGNYLSLPCPGTGSDGDPNVSLYLSPEIKAAIEKGEYPFSPVRV